MSSTTQTSSSDEIKNTTSKTTDTIPTKLLKNYIPISTISYSIGLLLFLSFAGAVDFISFKKEIVTNLTTNGKRGVLDNKNMITLHNFLMFLAVSSVLFSYIFGIYYKIILNGKNNVSASLLILFCIFTIMGITYISTSPVIRPFVDIVKIFENTIGYSVVNIVNSSKLQTVLNILFSNKRFSANTPFPNMSVSYNFMISVLSLDNYSDILSLLDDSDVDNPNRSGDYDYHISSITEMIAKFNNMDEKDKPREIKDSINNIIVDNISVEERKKYYNIIKVSCKDQLAEYVFLKNFIGQLCWVFISALITILITIKYLSHEK